METGGAESTGRGWRGLGLGTRLGLLLAVLAVLANALLLSLLYLNSRERIRENARARLREAAALAALSLDVARHDRIAIPSSVEGEDFQAVREALRRVMDQAPEANYVYTMRQDDQGRIVFVGDAGERHDSSALTSPGEVYHDASPFLQESFASLDRPVAERDFYTDKWGVWLTGYAPFFRADGTRAGVLGLDMSAASLQAVEARYLRRSGLAFAALIPVFLVLGVLLGRRLAAPVNALRDSAASLASGVFTSRVKIGSGGEIGDLAASFNAMAERVEAVFDGMLDELAERQVAEERLRLKEKVLEDVVRSRTGKLEAALAEAEARVEELERAHRLHAARCELGSRLVGAGGQHQTAQLVVEMVLLDDGLDCAGVCLAQEDGSLRLEASRGIGESHALFISSFQPGERHHSLVQSGRPFYAEGPALAWVRESCPDDGLRSAVVLPLLSGDRVLGVLFAGSRSLEFIPSAARDCLESTAALAAGALARDLARVDLEGLNAHLERVVASRTVALAEQARELSAANRRMQALDSLKNAFLSAMSREFRTPLNSVVGSAKLSSRDFERRFLRLAGEDAALRDRGERILHNLGVVEREAARLGLMLDGVLGLCRMEEGKAEWENQDVRMVPLLMRAAEAVSGMLAAKPGVVLEMDLPEGLPDLYLDPDKALQAVVIILDNAIKYTAAGTVRLSARALGSEALQVRVQDSGPGIAPEQRERIFEGFFRGAQAPDEGVEPRGAGLGLTIARRIVEHYGGRIRVESELGKGSTFFIEL
ncbi:MAG: ATP-binding protein [Thermodesulfobacteriota bacterium]